MGRYLTLLLGLAVVAGLAYYTLKGTSPLASQNVDVQAQQGLQNVRKEAKRIEEDAQRRVDETVKKADPEE